MNFVYVVVLYQNTKANETCPMERFLNKYFDNTKIELRSSEYD